MLAVVAAVAELSLAVAAEEACLLVVDHGVVLEAVETGERGLADLTLVWLDSWWVERKDNTRWMRQLYPQFKKSRLYNQHWV